MLAHHVLISVLLAGAVTALACTGNDGDPNVTSVTSSSSTGGQANLTCDPLGPALAPGTAPIERGDMAFAADPECNRVIMFFGDHAVPVMCGPSASEFMTDGYAYDAGADVWTEIQVAGAAPLQRARASATWDEASKRLILFGGRYRDGTAGPYTFLNDLWAFDPATKTWEELSPQDAPGAPTGRMNTSLDADPDRNRVIVHAGGTTDMTSYFVNNETWAFDLGTRTWSRLGMTGTLPSARLFHVAALDRQAGRLYVFGGAGPDAFTAATFFRDLWYLDFATDVWTQVPNDPNFPAGRMKSEMSYDGARNRLLLFAGHDDTDLGNTNDLWAFDLAGQSWTLLEQGDVFAQPADGFCDFPADFATIDPASPERRESHLFDVVGDVAVMFGGRTDCGLAKDTWELDLAAPAWRQINESPLGMTCRRSGSLQCDDAGARLCI